jgi:hypothetical protein
MSQMDTDGLSRRIQRQHTEWYREREQDRLASMLPEEREPGRARRLLLRVARVAFERVGDGLTVARRHIYGRRVVSALPTIEAATAPDRVKGQTT